MVNLEPIALAALADGGAAGILSAAGGALRVALFNGDTECAGNGYSRKSTTTVANAVNVSGETQVSFGDVTFSAVGGDIEYDSLRIYSRSGHVLFGQSGPGATQTIEPGEPHTVTTTIRFPASPAVPCSTAAQVQATINTDDVGVVLAPTRIGVTSEIAMVDGVGGSIVGFAATERASSVFSRLRSTLEWNGDRGPSDTEAVLRITRSDVELAKFSIDGATDAEILAGVVGKGNVGIHVERAIAPWNGVGTGKFKARDLALTYLKKGIRIATNLADGNCDESTWDDMFFDRCDVGVSVENYQGLEHQFHAPRFRLTDECFSFTAGGKIKVFGGNMTHPGALFSFPAGSDANFGQNNNSYSTHHFVLDSQATGGKIINQAPISGAGYYTASQHYSLHIPSPQVAGIDRPYWSLEDGTDINDIDPICMFSGWGHHTFYSPINLQRGAFAWDCGAGGRILVDVYGGYVWHGNGGTALSAIEQVCNLAKSRGTAYFRLIGCKAYGTLAPFADFIGPLTGLLP